MAGSRRAAVTLKEQTEGKGLDFARFVRATALAKGNPIAAHEIIKSQYPNRGTLIDASKQVISAGTTQDPTWAAPLVSYNTIASEFIDYLRPRTIIGQFGANGIPALRKIPFNVSIVGQTSGGSAGWVGEGAAKPLTRFDYAETNLRWAKVAAIAVLTQELLRFSNPDADALVRDALAGAVIERLDMDFVDPAKAAVTDVSPASITNGVAAIVSSGADADAIDRDMKALIGTFLAANNLPTSAVILMSSTLAFSLSLMKSVLGEPLFPDLGMNGGTFNKLPVLTSQYIPAGTVILANANDIFLADDGQVVIDASGEASLEMVDNPTNNSATGQGAQLVSMFQTNSVAVRAERWINWQKRRPSAVAVLSGVAWGEDAS